MESHAVSTEFSYVFPTWTAMEKFSIKIHGMFSMEYMVQTN